MRARRLILLLSFGLQCATANPPPVVVAPAHGVRADHHQHLFSAPDVARAPSLAPIDARALVGYLDAAGIERAVLLSMAYQFGNPNKPPVADEYRQVRAENDWTAAEAARAPSRLYAVCSFNPLKAYALRELERCHRDSRFLRAIKLHLGNSDVDLDDAAQVARVRTVFERANRRRMAIIVHARTSVTRQRAYGAAQARTFVTELLPMVPDVVVQLAHLAGQGGYDEPEIDAALGVFAEAIERHDPVVRRLYIDLSGVAGVGEWRAHADQIVRRIRQIGIDRVLYGSDGTVPPDVTPASRLAAFRELPLEPREIASIEANVAPYLKK